MVLMERSTVALDYHRQGSVGEKKGTECADDGGFEHVDLGIEVLAVLVANVRSDRVWRERCWD